MPWSPFALNNGLIIPGIAFGTWKRGNGEAVVIEVKQALHAGIRHIDTAQVYGNEYETGIGLQESELKREDVFVTTKWSGLHGLNISTSIQNSLSYLNLSYVDLYLVHHPGLGRPDIATVWAEMEEVYEKGYAKSIGISNFEVSHMDELFATAKVPPAVNQIEFHPYVYAQQLPILEYAAAKGIVVEAYSPLTPVVTQPGGPLDEPLAQISSRLNATSDQILLAWAKAKGTVPVTTSSKQSRLEGYLAAGDLPLTAVDIARLDAVGGYKRPLDHSAWLAFFGLVILLYGVFVLAKLKHSRAAQSNGAIALPAEENES